MHCKRPRSVHMCPLVPGATTACCYRALPMQPVRARPPPRLSNVAGGHGLSLLESRLKGGRT